MILTRLTDVTWSLGPGEVKIDVASLACCRLVIDNGEDVVKFKADGQ